MSLLREKKMIAKVFWTKNVTWSTHKESWLYGFKSCGEEERETKKTIEEFFKMDLMENNISKDFGF